MWGVPGVLITLLVFYVISIFVYQRGRGLGEYEKISVGDFEKNRSKRGSYSVRLALFELVFLMTIVVQVIYYGFNKGNGDVYEQYAFMFLAGVLFIVALMRFTTLWHMRLYYTDSHLVMEKGLYKKEIPLDQVEEAHLMFYWLGIVRQDKFWFTFIPLGFRNMREVKGLLNGRYEIAVERDESERYEESKKIESKYKEVKKGEGGVVDDR